MALIRFIMVCTAVMVSAMTADAQLRMVSREKLQEVANPALSADSASLSFEQKHIIAEPMNEDDVPKTFVYRFTNIGKETVAIKRLVSTCSCASNYYQFFWIVFLNDIMIIKCGNRFYISIHVHRFRKTFV